MRSVIFSDDRVSSFIRDHFIAAWESVRPVPLVEIDFGGGRKIKRTVNGNVATCVCEPEGRILDVIPGLNAAESYLEDLRLALNLYGASRPDFDTTVLDYHRANLTRPTVYEYVRRDFSKSMIERPMRMSLDERQELIDRQGSDLHIVRGPAAIPPSTGAGPAFILSVEEAALLAADTELNRRERRPILHRILSEKIVRPAEVTRRIYREALHCDLEDPYLGLISGAFQGGAYADR